MLNHPKFKQIRHELQGNYHYFYQLCQSLYQRYCPRCVTQRRNLDQRSKYNQSLGRSIEQRPIVVNRRNRIGDFELDTIVGPRGHSKAVLLTLIDRKSRFLWAYRLKTGQQ